MFFFCHGRFGEGRSRLMRVSCAWTVGTIIFPHLVHGDSGQCIFSRYAWQGGPRWLNYPAVLVTPAPLFTQTKPQRIERRDERANGLGLSCLLLDTPRRFYSSQHHLFNLSNSYASWFHINDNKIALPKCLRGLGFGQTHWGLQIRSPFDYHGTCNNTGTLLPEFVQSFKGQIGLSFLIPFFNTSISLITTGELQTSTLKNVCCWDTWLITSLPTQF